MARWVVCFAALVFACGPHVTMDGTQEEGSTSTTTSTTTTTSTSTSTSTSTTTSTSTSTTDSEDTTTGDESSETTGMCSCEGMPIGLDDEVDDGYTPAELLEATAFSVPSLEWRAIEGDPVSAVSGGTAYRGGLVVDEVGGCCGSFLCAPCPEGVTIESVQLTVTTADGRLDEVFVGTLTGDGLGGFQMELDALPIASLGGTLGNDTFDLDGAPFTPTTITVSIEWDEDFALERLWVFGDDGKNGGPLGLYGPV